jgi:hypothetical protein
MTREEAIASAIEKLCSVCAEISKEMRISVAEEPKLEVAKWYEAIERHIGIAKDEPKLDRWYKRAGRSLVYLTGITRGVGYGYGFDIDGNWFDRCNGNPIFIDCLVEASYQEVEEALVKEAKRRGYKSGVTAIFGSGRDQRTISSDSITWEAWNDTMALSMGCDVIFRQDTGKWAEIIEVDKFAELKEARKKGAVIQVKNLDGKWSDIAHPRWYAFDEYRIKPEDKPEVGNIVKAWCRNEEHYVVGNLTDIKKEYENKYGVHILGVSDIRNTIYYANARTVTKQEAIELLFGGEVQS